MAHRTTVVYLYWHIMNPSRERAEHLAKLLTRVY